MGALHASKDGRNAGIGYRFWGILFRLGGTEFVLVTDFGRRSLLEHHHQQDVEPIHPIATLKAPVHHLGIHSSRAWGCAAAFEATRDRQWEASFIQHMAAASALHPVWRHNGYAYTHWVPQFLVYALAEWDVATSTSRF